MKVIVSHRCLDVIQPGGTGARCSSARNLSNVDFSVLFAAEKFLGVDEVADIAYLEPGITYLDCERPEDEIVLSAPRYHGFENDVDEVQGSRPRRPTT
jgi:hypothetical protein